MSTVNVGNSASNPVPVNVNAALPAGGNTIGNVNIQAQGTALNADGSGNLKVAQQGTVTVSGTVTANIGTTNGLALDSNYDQRWRRANEFERCDDCSNWLAHL